MWHLLEKISEQVNTYSTVFGKLWYLCVFLYRLIVIATIGGAVYGDEQSAFKCNTIQIGCQTACFNQFSKISHIRFWAFQLLAVVTPTVLFHFYSTKVAGEIEKLKKAEEDFQADESVGIIEDEESLRKLWRRKQNIGLVEVKKVYTPGGSLKEIPYTSKIRCAYVINVLMRLALEGTFLYISYMLFKFPRFVNDFVDSPFDFVIFRVPAAFQCMEDEETKHACYQHHIAPGNSVTCWVSRPWEKTIFIGYMNVLSVLCCILSFLELVYLVVCWLVRNIGFSKSKRSMCRRWDSCMSDPSIKSQQVFFNECGKRIPSWDSNCVQDNGNCRRPQRMSRV